MKCEQVEKLLPFLHDGSLTPDIAREVGEHVERCGHCRAEFAELARTMQLVRRGLEERTPVAPPAVYREAVMQKIRKRKQERTVVSWAVPVAAALFLVASLSSYTLFHSDYGTLLQTKKPSRTIIRPAAAPVDEQGIINTMYNYADVSVYDVLNHLEEEDLEAEGDFEGIIEE
ncbi:MAG: anti-sigma factor family protein [Candidatus Latescibacterota bacterium]